MRRLAALLLVLLTAAPALADDLPDPFASFLEEVAPLITDYEREAFAQLAADYQRRAFIEQFWRVRDPFPETGRNELRERWQERAAEARQRFTSLQDPRARIYLINGDPSETVPFRCGTMLYPLEIWHYRRGSDALRGEFYVVFLRRPGPGGSPYRLWNPTQGLVTLVAGASAALNDSQLLAQIGQECIQGDRLTAALTASADWARIEEERKIFPDPGEEWVQTFLTYGTDVPEDAEPLAADLSLGFPGARGGRTVVQGVVSVAREAAETAPEGGESYDYLLDGEVLRRDELFERFRYRFRLPAEQVAGDAVPLLFQRYLRPGLYRLVIRAEELASGRFFRREMDLEVPFVRPGSERRAAPTPVGSETAATDATPEAAPTTDPAAEANRTLGRGDVVVRLLPPPQGLQVDNTRIEAVVEGDAVARVRFELNGKPVLTKGRPPYSVELDLGEAPRNHEVTAVALAADGEELARDRMLVNGGPHRFAVRLVEPQPGRTYQASLRAAAEVDVPEGDVLERLELFLNEELVATLYQPPFAQPILLPPGDPISYVRAVAYLAGGAWSEDVVLVNAPDQAERLDVHFVELYTSVLDRRGRPIEGLEQGDFRVLEDGVEQRVRRFELVRELPIYAGLLLDTSSSMVEELDEALEAAHRFFETVITPRDRAAVITFNHQVELAVRFTNDPEVLAGGLSGVGAAGGTALYDSLIYALYYFSGVQGKRALILISDGEDQGSRYGFEEALDYARRTGVAIYTIGLGTGGSQPMVRSHLLRLASETGGQSFFVHRAFELANVYNSIETELRTQYLLAYQSSKPGRGDGEDEFREVKVEVARPGAEAKTIRGYYP
ncbi:MAG TPA: VWA domain-containing protein [Thermoanaerobaculia bacterium]|nr:VWA domain-containing protein [Thermoanaerobaculia bacterium]